MPMLKNNNTPSVNPFDVTLIFPNDKPYPWRGENDVTIDPNDTENPLAHLYDERVLNPVPADTIANVQEFGVRQPVTLVEQGKAVYKVDGLGRIKAARMATIANREKGLPEINVPYIKSSEKDHGTLAALSISLNAHREDDTPLKKARLAALLIERYNWTPSQAANYFKVSITAIKQWLSVVQNAAPAVLKATEKGKIAFTTAASYVKMPQDEQEAALQKDLDAIEGRTQARSDKPKKLSGSEVGKAAKKAELLPDQVAEKRFQKVMDLLEEMEPADRLRVFARFDATTGEEAAIYRPAEVEEASVADADDDTKELTTVYDDVVIESEDAPTVKRRKRAATK